ncbi:MAG TPA: PepSY domain-containing protein [Longimicrobiales bacterium]|nr:PepSY domain-containing protein [Longimicrobiales bacterium]
MGTIVRGIAVAAVALSLVGGACAQTVTYDQLPQAVKETLEAKFPGAEITKATREMEGGEVIYDIEMTRAGRKHEMDAREDGSIVNFENQIQEGALPAAVTAALQEEHPGSTIVEAMETMVVEDGEDVLQEYEVTVRTAEGREVEHTISPDGRIIE